MTGIGKIRRKVSANSNEPFHSRKNCAAVSIGISLEFSPADQGQVQDSRSSKNKKQPRPIESKPGEREKILLLGAGGTGNVQEKTFLINCHRTGGEDRYGSGISPDQWKKSQPHCRNSFLPESYHSAVLMVWSCDSSVARYSRSEARSACSFLTKDSRRFISIRNF